MTLRDLVEHVMALRKAQLERELDATLNADSEFTYDHDGGEIKLSFYGHCRKVHPDLVETYPNGWSMVQDETLDEALDKLNLTLELKPC